jgi:hypothetical protein
VSPPLLPAGRDTLLLAAMLLDGASARDAWSRWLTASGRSSAKQSLAEDSSLARSQLALLYDSVRRNEIPVDEPTMTYLRSAFLTERLRTQTIDEIVATLTRRLEGLRFRFMKGNAVARYYREPALRHAHDLELLTADRESVMARLQGSDFRRDGDHFVHHTGLPLRIHTQIDGLVPDEGTTDALVLCLVHASRSPSRATGRWVTDAVHLIRSGEIDWSLLTHRVRAVRATSTTCRQLHWLQRAVGAKVPDEVLTRLRQDLPWWRALWLRV